MLAGKQPGGEGSTDLNTLFDGAAACNAGTLSEEELKRFEDTACPTCGSCSGMFTANSMNCLTEALGIALPGNGTIPAVYSERFGENGIVWVVDSTVRQLRLNKRSLRKN